MSKKMMLLATALTALAFAALPAVASAGTPQVHCPGVSGTSCAVNITGGPAELTKTNTSLKIECTSLTGKGTVETTKGSIQLTFHGCRESLFKTACTGTLTAGEPSGTIETTVLPFDNIYTGDNKTTPGVLVTPNGGHFATFNCIDGKHVVGGNGVIGTLTAPACGGTSASLGLSFTQASAGHQTHKQITGTGTIFDLTEGGNTAAQVGSGTATIAGGGNFVVTCV